MTPTEIRAAIAADQDLQALVPDTVALAAALSAGRTAVRSRMISERGILDAYPDGPVAADAVMVKLETFAAGAHTLSGVVKRALKFLGTDAGIDLGVATTRAMLDALAAADVITADEATKLKSLADQPAPVSEFDVRRAIFNDDGSLAV